MGDLTNYYKRIDDVKDRAQGKWRDILYTVAPGLRHAIDRLGDHVPCPVHGGTDGFRLFRDNIEDKPQGICNTCSTYDGHQGDIELNDGFKLITWSERLSFHEALLRVEQYLGGTAPAYATPPPLQVRKGKSNAEKIHDLTQVWNASIPMGQPGAELIRTYFNQARGIPLDALPNFADLRLHPKGKYCKRLDEKNWEKGEYPMICARIRQADGLPVTFQRTYLRMDGLGKAPVSEAKMTFPYPKPSEGGKRDYRGAGIWLDEPGVIQIGAEGLENTLSARAILGYPSVATAGKGQLGGLILPSVVRLFLIFSDDDDDGDGQRCAEASRDHAIAQGAQALIFMPPRDTPRGPKGTDWNDALRHFGVDGLRAHPWYREAYNAIENARRKLFPAAA